MMEDLEDVDENLEKIQLREQRICLLVYLATNQTRIINEIDYVDKRSALGIYPEDNGIDPLVQFDYVSVDCETGRGYAITPHGIAFLESCGRNWQAGKIC